MSPRVVVLDEPEYTASYHITDLGEGRLMTFVHLDVYYMSKEILKRLDKQWRLWRQCVPVVLYAISDDDEDVWAKFVKRFGFQYLSDIGCTDGKTRRLFVNFGPQNGPTKEAQEQ
jgi:hypothetical protein